MKAARAGRKPVPIAYGSVHDPCPGRDMFAVSYACPVCGGTHFGRSREAVTSGPRRSRCGVMIWLVIADGYRAGSADLMRAFGDGWRCGLEARAERGTAA